METEKDCAVVGKLSEDGTAFRKRKRERGTRGITFGFAKQRTRKRRRRKE